MARRRPEGMPPGKQAHDESLEAVEEQLDEVASMQMPLLEHLMELKDRLIWAFGAALAGTLICFAFAKEIYDFLKQPFEQALANAEGVAGGLALVNSPFEGVYTYFKVAVIGGLLLSSPVIFWQIWKFVAPGLYDSEQKVVLPLTVASVALFLSGAAFCYYGIFPYAFPFFMNVLGVDVNLSVGGYLSAVIRMMLAFGLCFQIPVGAFFLARMGFVDHKDLLGFFRYAIVIIFILAAFITPPDPLTQTLLALPMVLLYGVGILVARIWSTKKRDEVEAA